VRGDRAQANMPCGVEDGREGTRRRGREGERCGGKSEGGRGEWAGLPRPVCRFLKARASIEPLIGRNGFGASARDLYGPTAAIRVLYGSFVHWLKPLIGPACFKVSARPPYGPTAAVRVLYGSLCTMG
jgi:hypothetical protein